MYAYVYDEFLEDRRYERELALIETRLTDLGITGKILRLALFRDAVQVVRQEVRAGATTIVAVGNDDTLYRVIEAVGDSRVVVAFIPVGGTTPMADLLGVPTGALACDILSARLVADMDLGEVNGRRFLHAATIDASGGVMECEDKYTLTPTRKCTIEIRNLYHPDDIGNVDPTDGRMTIVTRLPKLSLFRKNEDVGVLHLKRAHLSFSAPRTMTVDGEKIEAEHFDIRAIPNRLRLVTGKDRKFVA